MTHFVGKDSAHTSLTKYSTFHKLPSDEMPIHTLCGVALITGAAAGQLRTLDEYSYIAQSLNLCKESGKALQLHL